MLDPSVGIGLSTHRSPKQPQAGLLAHGSIYSPDLPISDIETVALPDFVPVHSGGTAPELHGIPY